MVGCDNVGQCILVRGAEYFSLGYQREWRWRSQARSETTIEDAVHLAEERGVPPFCFLGGEGKAVTERR